MALVFNPLSGEMEDDGTGQPDTAAPPPQPTGLEPGLPGQTTFAEGAGAAPVAAPSAPALPVAPASAAPASPATPAPLAVPVLSAKPEWEQHRRVESAKDKDATAKLEQSRAKQEEAADKADAAKQAEAETKAEDARVRRLMEERRQIQFQLAESEKKQKIAEHMAADKAAIEESAKEEAVKNSAGNLTGTAKVFATLMTALGDAGQTLAALGTRGTAAFQDANPIAEFYEKERQKRIAAAKADFDKNERVRALRKAGRTDELKVLEDRLTIGINNEFQRDVAAQDATLAARLARLGLNSQKAGAEMLKAGRAVVNANVDRENAQLYDSTVTNRSPTGGAGAATLLAQQKSWVPDPVTGEPVPTPDAKPEEAAQARAAYGALDGLRDWKGRMAAFITQHGQRLNDWDPDTKNQYASLQTEAAGYLTKLNESGVLNEGEFKRYSAIAAPSGISSILTTKKGVLDGLDEIVTGAQSRYAGKARSLLKGAKLPGEEGPQSRAKTDLGRQVEAKVKGAKSDDKFGPVETRTFKGPDGTRQTVKVRLNHETGKYDEVE